MEWSGVGILSGLGCLDMSDASMLSGAVHFNEVARQSF